MMHGEGFWDSKSEQEGQEEGLTGTCVAESEKGLVS